MVTVLFVCVENSCRSQMAEGFAQKLGKGILKAYSAGSRPSGTVNPMAISVMSEEGIDISNQGSKGFNQLPVKKFNYVITLGCKDICPFVSAEEHIEWNIDDPKGGSVELFRRVRDDVRSRVADLVDGLLKKDR